MRIWIAALGLLTIGTGTARATPATLFSFDGTNGAGPQASLAMGAGGNLFGATSAGGAGNGGAVPRISGCVTAATEPASLSVQAAGPFSVLVRHHRAGT